MKRTAESDAYIAAAPPDIREAVQDAIDSAFQYGRHYLSKKSYYAPRARVLCLIGKMVLDHKAELEALKK